jgi:N-acetylglucosaminyldiphosphoundecaprenol N-acetyl-beta-D-mannosaminyltransferase
MEKACNPLKETDADSAYEVGGRGPTAAAAAVPTIDVFGSRVDAIDYDELLMRIIAWTRRPEPHRICLAGVPSIIFSRDLPEWREAHGSADLVLPDGMPLVWHLRRAGYREQQRLDGPNMVYRICADAERHAIPVGFYGSTADTVERIRKNLLERHACARAPRSR